MDLTSEKDLTQVVRHDPPSHYSFEIKSFSLLSELGIEEYQSCTFEVGGYKWNLLLHPNGDKTKGVNDHISLYLEAADTNNFSPDWELKVVYKFSVFDQIMDNYLTVGDAEGTVRRFHRLKPKWGFTKFMPLKRFTDPTNGYLVDDSCVFGVEIFILHVTLRNECLSLKKNPETFNHKWNIKKFSKITKVPDLSEVFTAGGYKWQICLYPNGDGVGADNRLSIYLSLVDSDSCSPSDRVYTKFAFRVRSPKIGSDIQRSCYHWFENTAGGWGFPKFIGLDKFKNPNNGYLVGDEFTLETEITVHGDRKQLPKTKYQPYSSKEGIELTCTICMNTMKEETSTTCGHIFCKSCINQAIGIQKRCPTCRKELLAKDIHRIYIS